MLLEAASAYTLTDAPIPQAGFHHAHDVFEVLLKCMSDDGAPVYFAGNDWKLVHTQGSDIINYCMMNLLLDDPRAAYLEPIALDWIRRIQKVQKGHFNDRRDLEYGGLVASRLINCYLSHAKRGAGCEPVSKAKFHEDAAGTLLLKRGSAILHRTPSKFTSFAWGRARLGLALGKSGMWTHWPHYSSYLGHINSRGTRDKKCRVVSIQHDVQPNGFRVVGSLERGGSVSQGGVRQDFAFLSPPSDLVIYIERLRYQPGKLASRHTGLEYPLGENKVTLQGSFGQATLCGVEEKAKSQNWMANWINVNNQIGYVIRRSSGEKNQVFYYDMTKGSGRVPKLQEWISLIGDEPSKVHEEKQPEELESWACVVTFLNQTSVDTQRQSKQVYFKYHGNTATCRIGSETFQIDFPKKNR